MTGERICRIARCCPVDLGLPFSTWSLAKLGAYLVEQEHLAPISHETLRQILKAGGVSVQVTKTWKASENPDFTVKKDRVLDLYDHPPADGRVVCVDEFGSLNLATSPWPRLVSDQVSGAAACDLHPHVGGAAHVRRARSGLRADVLSDPGPEAVE